jgi:hypothetical protein
MTNEKYVFKIDPNFNPLGYPLGKDIKRQTRLRAIMRRCNILDPKYGNFTYVIVAKEHTNSLLVYGIKQITNIEGNPIYDKPFWIPRSAIEIERVID